MAHAFDKKVALVTGTGSGNGWAIAIAFAREGACILETDINVESVEETARLVREAGAGVLALKVDVAKTSQVRHAIDRFGQGDHKVHPRLEAMHPLGQMGTPEEVAAATVWLCSDVASFVTGHIMPVDGGLTAR